jgi:hypothetical protein
MHEPEWTPGRWECGDNDGESIVIYSYPEDGGRRAGDGQHIATVMWPSEDAYDYTGDGPDLDAAIRERAQAWPNAVLIAHAPQLYDTLRRLVEAIEEPDGWNIDRMTDDANRLLLAVVTPIE